MGTAVTELGFFPTLANPAPTPVRSQLTLSLFPGADLFGRGFEEEGFCVVRGPDFITGGDVRAFHAPAGRFDGVFGGPPCPDFSRARRGPPSPYGEAMVREFLRVVAETAPRWFLMENVPGVPSVVLHGYTVQRLDLDASQFGLRQRRLRHFQFGSVSGLVLCLPRGSAGDCPGCDPTCLASDPGGHSWPEFCALQGLPPGFDLPGMTREAKFRAVGNGVPVPMARALARAVLAAAPSHAVSLCVCGCGRTVTHRGRYALPRCRKAAQRRRDGSGQRTLHA